MTVKLFETNRLVAYQLDASFAATVLSYFEKNADHFKKSMPSWPESFFTFDYQVKLLMKQNQQIALGTMFKYWLFDKDDTAFSKIIGDVGLSQIIRNAFQSCYIGYKLDLDYIGKGLMQEAMHSVINHSFTTLKLHRIEANIMPSNLKSIALAERLSFKKEGFSPSYLKINGKWENHIRYALINEDFEE